ncbi:ABC transporter ATP-binding protein [Corynebacterium sp. zg-331]|uniref:ATP-binding cassette domain-containing protein n=1 Tax=unclassified Corynebacterium TaxID=2624378 RepID=UPI00128E2B2A|nr:MULTISPECIES: ABC transporter ATP-binding protein [unclassified Corynebacterium]MBC3186549.1 ABC transporter ATP-binding protein [Corynebacterium sp. zg-331]MPV53032.1 ATP-binding cassette domain-containing protein [Corynebacterium sp. zg331]
MNAHPLIQARDLRARYARTRIFQGLRLCIPTGGIHGLVGPNGAGKTTLLRLFSGQLPHDGSLTVWGEDPFDNPQIMQRVALAGIDAPLPADWHATRLFRVAAVRYSTWDQGRALALLRAFSLPGDKKYSALSRGQKSALGIAFALAAGCDLTLLDEPYLGLDVEKRGIFYRELRDERDRRPDASFLLSTHELHESEKLLDAVTIINGAGVQLSGSLGEILEGYSSFLGPSGAVRRLIDAHPGAVLRTEELVGSLRTVLALPLAAARERGIPSGVRAQQLSLEELARAIEEAQ